MAMIIDNNLESCTSVCIRNLAPETNEEALEHYFRVNLEPPKCQVTLYSHFETEPATVYAFIDLGSKEKVHQAIRELNGTEMGRRRILVSLAIRHFTSFPGNKLYLKQLPIGITNSDLYDYLSQLGTIVSIINTYDLLWSNKIYISCVTFLTEEQAQHVIQVVNASRFDKDAMYAEADGHYVADNDDDSDLQEEYDESDEPDADSYVSQESADTMSTHEGSTTFSGDDNDPPGTKVEGSAPITPPEAQSFPEEMHSPQLSVSASAQCGDVQDTDKSVYPPEANEAAKENSPEEEEEEEEEEDKAEEADTGTVPTPDRTPLDLSIYASDEERRQAVYDFLFNEYKDEVESLENFVRVLEILRTSLDPYHLLENSTNASRLQLYIYLASAALKNRKKRITQLSIGTLKAADDMQLAFVSSDAERVQAVRECLSSRCRGRYPSSTANKVLDLLAKHLDFWDQLELVADEKRFFAAVFHAKLALETNEPFRLPSLSDAMVALIHQLELDKWKKFRDIETPLREFLFRLHEVRYGKERLARILDASSTGPATPLTIYDLLLLCVEASRFHIHAAMVESALENKCAYRYLKFTQVMMDLIRQLKLDQLDNMKQWKQPLYEYLYSLHQKQYGTERLEKILQKLFDSVTLPQEFYGLFQMSLDESCFCINAAIAERALEKISAFSYTHLTSNAMKVVRQLKLDKLESVVQWEQPLREYLHQVHQERYGNERLKGILDTMFGAMSAPVIYFKVLDFCSNSTRSLIHIMLVEHAMENKCNLIFEYFSDEVVNLVRQLKLDELDRVAQWKELLNKHLFQLYQAPYGDKRLARILNVMLDALRTSRDYFEMLAASTDAIRFKVQALIVEYAIENREPFVFLRLSNSMLNLVDQQMLDKLESVAQWKRPLRKYLVGLHSEKYGTKRLEKILDCMFDTLISPRQLTIFLEVCPDPLRFSVYAALAEYAVKNRCIFCFTYLNYGMTHVIRHLKLDKLDNVAQWEQPIREYLVRLHQEKYGEQHLEEILTTTFSALKTPRMYYQLLEICANRETFHELFPP